MTLKTLQALAITVKTAHGQPMVGPWSADAQWGKSLFSANKLKKSELKFEAIYQEMSDFFDIVGSAALFPYRRRQKKVIQ